MKTSAGKGIEIHVGKIMFILLSPYPCMHLPLGGGGGGEGTLGTLNANGTVGPCAS